MSNFFGVFSRTAEPAVLSLDVQARMPVKEVQQMNRFVVLVWHFFMRFFSSEITALDEQDGTRVIQVLCALALPGLLFAIGLMPSYFILPPNVAPRGYWPRISDHYFYVMYSMTVLGAATVFEWDMLFPDLLDVLVLTPLPVPARKLFAAKISALGVFLVQFLLAANLFAAVLLPLIAEEPSILRHFAAHVIAVSLSGLFSAAFFVALQGALINAAGERIIRAVSPVLQGVSLAGLLIVLFLFPLVSHNLQSLLLSGSPAVRWFPPFWFLGIYEWILQGASAPAIFSSLAFTGCWMSLCMLVLAMTTYPLAYRRKTRRVMEGLIARRARSWLTEKKDALVHMFMSNPEQRAVYHFIGYALKRVPRHRIYLALYGGFGLALVLAISLAFSTEPGRVHLIFSPSGLRAAIPMTAFWVIVGIRAAFMSPVDLRANWIFHCIGIRPNLNRVAATQRWTLLRSAVITVAVACIACALSSSSSIEARDIASQILLAEALSLLLVDSFFLRWVSVPFTAPLSYSGRNIAFSVPIFLLVFPLYIEKSMKWGIWMKQSAFHFALTVVVVLAVHAGLMFYQRNLIRERALLPVRDEIEEFPQRLGLL